MPRTFRQATVMAKRKADETAAARRRTDLWRSIGLTLILLLVLGLALLGPFLSITPY